MTLIKRKPASKLKHIEACILKESQYIKKTGFEQYDFISQAACDLDFSSIDLGISFLNKTLGAPLMIAPMTGGTKAGLLLNQRWAKVAQHFGLAMGVGSQRLALETKQRQAFYDIRSQAPDILLFANLGAEQLTTGYGSKEALEAVCMIGADALFIHFNAMQEWCQKKDVHFKGVLNSLENLCKELSKHHIPVFAREVCFGLSKEACRRFIEAGVSGLDCAGAGGTSWAKVEALCATDPNMASLGRAFGEWGIPTAQSIVWAREAHAHMPLIATGGIQNGHDAIKALILGADVASMGRPFLIPAMANEEALFSFTEGILLEMKGILLGLGLNNVQQLKSTKKENLLYRKSSL